MLATLVIFLREGVEASMIVAILLAYLNRTGHREHFRDVFLGVGAALILATAGGAVAYETIRSYDGSRVQTIFETATFLVAATVLTYMTFWMRKHARSLSKELRARADAALDGRARWGLGLLAFQAVGREGLETVVFTLAIIFSTSTAGALSGAAIGLAGALVIAFVIYRLGHRLNLAKFFTVIGLLLMIFAAGLLADAVRKPSAARLAAGAQHTDVALRARTVGGQSPRRCAAQLLRLQRCPHAAAASGLRRLSGHRDSDVPGCASQDGRAGGPLTSHRTLITSGRAHAFGPYYAPFPARQEPAQR